MRIVINDPPSNAYQMTEQYITARYGCSVVEFARNLERELLASNAKAANNGENRDISGGGKCGRAANVQQAGD